MPDRECPECGQAAGVVVDVRVLGNDSAYGAVHGTVHPERIGEGAGSGWRLYCHEEVDET